MKPKNALTIAVLALLVGGCALTQAETPRQKLYAVDRQFAAVVHTATNLKREGKLNRDQAEQLGEIINTANEALNVAHAAVKANDDDTVREKLRTVRTAIVAIKDVIREARQ